MRRTLSCRRWGHHPSHPVVVLLAGAYLNAACWPSVFIDGLVDRGTNVLAMDLRDTGRNPWREPPFSLDDMAADVAHTLMVHRVSRAHLFGASMGGAVALRAARLDERVASLTLYATTPDRCLRPETLSAPRRSALRALEREQKLHRTGRVREALRTRHSTVDVEAILRRGYNPDAGHGAAFLAEPPFEDWGAVPQPTLVLHASDDPLFPVDHAWRLHHCLSRSKLHILPLASHGLPADEETLAHVADLVAVHARAHDVSGERSV